MVNSTDIPQIFELGKITITPSASASGSSQTFTGQILVEEISVNTSQDLHQYYTTDSFVAKDIRAGRRKYDFTIKKAEDRTADGEAFRELFEPNTRFDLTLWALNIGDDQPIDSPAQIVILHDCRISRDNIGNFDSSKPVQNDIEGQARTRQVVWADGTPEPTTQYT
jgi:hypothetical protein